MCPFDVEPPIRCNWSLQRPLLAASSLHPSRTRTSDSRKQHQIFRTFIFGKLSSLPPLSFLNPLKICVYLFYFTNATPRGQTSTWNLPADASQRVSFLPLGTQEQHLAPFGCTSRKRSSDLSVSVNKLRQKEPLSVDTQAQKCFTLMRDDQDI